MANSIITDREIAEIFSKAKVKHTDNLNKYEKIKRSISGIGLTSQEYEGIIKTVAEVLGV